MSKRIKEIDIFQRTLKCRRLPLEEHEIEIFDVESDDKLAEEEEICFESEPEIIPEALYLDLNCVKRQVQKLLLLLKAKLEPAPEPDQTCDEEAEICALQKAHHHLQCQIYELIRCYKLIREELQQMHSNFCVVSKDVQQLWRLVTFFQYSQEIMRPDEGVCHERYVYILRTRAEWSDVKALICQNSRCPRLLTAVYVSKDELHRRRVYLQAEIEKLKNHFVFLFEMKNPSYADEFVGYEKCKSIKQIELDYIIRQIRKNRALYDQDCSEYFKCDKIELK